MTVDQRLEWLASRIELVAQSAANVAEANQIFANAFRQIGELKKEVADLRAPGIR
ncbi:MAG TPA: hypothetical protein VEH07_01535 [Alphaproteobacteria bacterium]|nr:hypothetical protein [Alphaproteobacteria bacterium]